MDPLAPVTIEAEVEAPSPTSPTGARVAPPEPKVEADPRDPAFLLAHRKKLLAAQRLTRDDLAARMPGRRHLVDLAIALAYTLYVLTVGLFTLRASLADKHPLVGLAALALASVFLVLLWRSFGRSLRRARRSRTYEGMLAQRPTASNVVRPSGEPDTAYVAVFEGGDVIVPAAIQRELVPGVRYRVHAPGTDEVAVDVVLDEAEGAEIEEARARAGGAYR